VSDFDDPVPALRGFSIPIEVAELVSGDHTLEVRAVAPSSEVEGMGNVDLTVER
jgi:hypothetical protein